MNLKSRLRLERKFGGFFSLERRRHRKREIKISDSESSSESTALEVFARDLPTLVGRVKLSFTGSLGDVTGASEERLAVLLFRVGRSRLSSTDMMEFRLSSKLMMDMLRWLEEKLDPTEFIDDERCLRAASACLGRHGLVEPLKTSEGLAGLFLLEDALMAPKNETQSKQNLGSTRIRGTVVVWMFKRQG